MALPASDTFTAADSTGLEVYNTSWSEMGGANSFRINTNAVYPSGANDFGARWNADTFNDNQYAQLTIVAISVGPMIGPAVRCSSSANSYYEFYSDSGSSQVAKMVAGTWTQLGSNGAAAAVGNVLRIEADGTTITPKVDGSTSGIGVQTDSALTSGYGGLGGYDAGTGMRGDNWEAGNLGGGSPARLAATRALLGVGL